MMSATDELIRSWDDAAAAAAAIFADNIDFDRPPTPTPSRDRRPHRSGRSDASAFRHTGDRVLGDVRRRHLVDPRRARGELLCVIHLTPVRPAHVQEFEVIAVDHGKPRGARPTDISARRRAYARPTLSSLPNTHVV